MTRGAPRPTRSLGFLVRIPTKQQRGLGKARSLVPTDVPQLIQRPSDAVLLERQFYLPGIDRFSVNDEVRLLLNGFREFPEDLQASYNVIIAVSLLVMFVAFEGVELIREWNSNSEYVDEMDKADGTTDKGFETDEVSEAIKERRRGLGWLALITAIAVWATGALNTVNPFGQP